MCSGPGGRDPLAPLSRLSHRMCARDSSHPSRTEPFQCIDRVLAPLQEIDGLIDSYINMNFSTVIKYSEKSEPYETMDMVG